MTVPTDRGRKLLIALILVVMALAVMNVALFSSKVPAQFSRDLTNLPLEALFCFLLYRGYAWVRWTLVVLFGLASLLALYTLAHNFSRLPGDAIWVLTMGVAHTLATLLLLFSPSIRMFLAAQRAARQTRP